MKKKILLVTVLLGLVLTGCFNRPTPTLDMPQILTIAAQTAVVQATKSSFETQVARLTQGIPATAEPVQPTNTPIIITQQPTAVQPSNTPVTAATAAPTLPQPTAQPTVAPRPGNSYTAARLSTAPTLDGLWDEWNTTKFPIKAVVWNRTSTSWTDSADLEGSFTIGYDATNLYIAVKVLDETYSQNATAENIFKGDSIEILLDTDLNGDYYTTTLSADDYQLGLSPGKPDPSGTREAYLWYPQSVAGSRSQVKIGSVKTNDNWRLEASIPWSVLGITPASGMKLGFALSVSDCDDEGGTCQDSMISTAPGRVFVNPTTWGVLTLK